MNDKHRVLIVERQAEWLNILRRAFPADEFSVETVPTLQAALTVLEAGPYDLIVAEPAPGASAPGRSTVDEYGQRVIQEGLDALREIARRVPDTRLIVVSGVVDAELLQNTPDLPRHLPLFDKTHWDRTGFSREVNHLLKGAEPVSPEIVTPTESPIFDDDTQPVTATGLTRPLSTGLVPPPLGTRSGKPRILIIDDLVDWQHIIGQLVDREGYFWRVASGYDDAMERLNADSFHVVMLDLRLDDGDVPIRKGKGWHLLDYLVKECPRTKVIIMSEGATGRDIAKLFTEYPIKGLVDKGNFDEHELMALIREQLTGPMLRIQTLGDFWVWRDGRTITDFGDPKAEIVLKLLITRRGEKVNADELAEQLFPGQEPKDCYTPLINIINRLRMELEPSLLRAGDSTFVLRSGNNYTFNFLANVDMDAEQFRRLVSEARQSDRRGDTEEALTIYEAARSLYTGDYLPDNRSELWALQERSAIQGLYTTTLNRIADLYAEKSQFDKAIEAATRSMQVDSYNESTYRRLMRYHYCKGNLNAALTVYKTLGKLFSEFFQEEPDLATKRLVEDMKNGLSVSCVESISATGEWRSTGEH